MMKGVFFGFVAVVLARPIIEPMNHDVRLITAKQFNSAIGKFRDGQVHALWFFDETKEDEKYLDIYDKVAKEFKDVISFHAIDCSAPANGKFCTSEHDVKNTPTVKYFPPNAILPPVLLKAEVSGDADKFKKKLIKQIPSKVTTLTAENIDEFMSGSASKPKIILFSKQDKPAWIFKAMSSAPVLERTLEFGFTSNSDLIAKYKKTIGKKLPALVMFREHGKNTEKYKGDLSFRDMKEWVNTFSESGMGDKVQGGGDAQEDNTSLEEKKPWLVQDIPELTQASHRDVCFKSEGLCVMYLSSGKISPKEEDMLKSLQSVYTSQLSGRGTTFKWMWMDMDVEGKFKTLFGPAVTPSVVVFNPHKRLRFVKPVNEDGDPLEEVVGEGDIRKLIDNILAGNARFKVVKGQKLPEWAKRETPGKQEAKQEL